MPCIASPGAPSRGSKLDPIVKCHDEGVRDHRRIGLDVPADGFDVGQHFGTLVSLDLGVTVAMDAGDRREQRQLLPVDGKAVQGAVRRPGGLPVRAVAGISPATAGRIANREISKAEMSYGTPSVEFAVKALPKYIEIVESAALVTFGASE